MRAAIDSGIRLDVREVPRQIQEALCEALAVPNPRATRRRGRRASEYLEREVLLEQRGHELRLPRGAIQILRQYAHARGLTVTCEDHRVMPPLALPLTPTFTLREYQAAAVGRLAKVTQGIVVVPCGGGKSRLGMGAMAQLRTPTLVLVHTLDLADQWREDLQQALGVTAGLIGGGRVRPAPITVALVQSLATWNRAELDRFLAGFGFVILDEAHHVSSRMFRAVVDRCPARYRLGLTATPDREDGLSSLLTYYLGARLLEVPHQQLLDSGVLASARIRCLETAFTYPYNDATDYAPMLDALVTNEERNQQVVDAVVAEAEAGHVCLVLSGRVEHCERLAARLDARGVRAAALTAAIRRVDRKRLLAAARAGEVSVLVATSLADEGLDLPRLGRVFLAFPGRARAGTTQRLGRLMRPHADKGEAVLVDVVDREVPILRRHHLERRKVYAEVLGVPASQLGGRGGPG